MLSYVACEGPVYIVQARINGYLIDEERCSSFAEAREAVDRRRRALMQAGAAIVVEDVWQYVVARSTDAWATVTVTGGEPH